MCRPVLALAESHAFDQYDDVIAVGTASREGEEIEEAERAGNRSRRLAEWVNLALRNTGRSTNVYAMNFGQYRIQPDDRPLSRDETSKERPVVLIGVVRRGSVDIASAVQEVLANNQSDPIFQFLASRYPQREIERYTALPASACAR